jgi:hypothetical protein
MEFHVLGKIEGQSYVIRGKRRFCVSVPLAEFEAATARKIDGKCLPEPILLDEIPKER